MYTWIMARNEDAVLKESDNSSSSSVVEYVCDCANCKGSSWYAYGTVRRHRSIFGINAKADLGVSFCSKTKERRPRPATNTGRLCAKYIVMTPCIASTA